MHFWFLACSGASISSQGSEAFQKLFDGSTPTPGHWGGMVDSYTTTPGTGTGPAVTLTPQVQRLQQLMTATGLKVNSLFMTVGADDLAWGPVLEDCLIGSAIPIVGVPLQNGCIANLSGAVSDAVTRLPAHFALLKARIDQLTPPIPASRIHLTDYFDPLDSLQDPQQSNPFCGGEILAGQFLRQWGVLDVEDPLQSIVQTTAQNDWTFLGGIRQAFQGHGVCQLSGRWINSGSDALASEGDATGTWHANLTGQQHMADIETPVMLSDASTQP